MSSPTEGTKPKFAARSGKTPDPRELPVAELSGLPKLAAIARRNWYWGRTHGWANLLEEHDLDLSRRIPRDYRKLRWRLEHPHLRGTATPVFLVGAQRSGTNMVTYGLSQSDRFAVYNEGNGKAFRSYRLREPQLIERLVTSSRHPYVLFKPLTESHRTTELLDGIGAGRSKALWVYRDGESRARSAVAKFGSSNLRTLRRWYADPAFRHWQLGGSAGLSEESVALLRRFDPDALSVFDGAALFWLIRNRIVFEAGLDEREDVLLVSYDDFIRSPAPGMRLICDFLGLEFDDDLVEHVEMRRAPGDPRREQGPIHPGILEECESLRMRLDRVVAQQASR